MPEQPADVRLAVLIAVVSVGAWWAQAVPTLTAPPAGAHAWRETDGLIVARNYCEDAAPFAEPRVDNRGDTLGRTGLEFPLLNWAAGTLGCASGDFVTPWRVASFALSVLGAAALFLVARARLGVAGGALALAIFATAPLVPYFSRTTQPDAAAMALAVVALALTQTRARWLAPLALCLAALLKLPALVYGLPVLVSLVQSAKTRAWRALAVASCASVLLPVALWYRHAHALELLDGLRNFGVSRTPLQLWQEWQLPSFWVLTFLQRPFDSLVFPPVSVLVLLAAVQVRGTSTLLARSLALTWLSYVFLCGSSGALHDYYGLMVLPLVCLAGAWALLQTERWLRRVRPAFAPVLLVAFFAGALGWQVHRSSRWWAAHTEAWQALGTFSRSTLGPAAGSRIVVFSDGSPQLFWFMHQRGVFGDGAQPGLTPGHWGAVDRRRLREDKVGLERALASAGCVGEYESELVWVCRQPETGPR